MPRLLIAFLCLAFVFTSARAADELITWGTPTKNVDETDLTNLTGYQLFAGPSESTLTQRVQLGPTVTRYLFENLAPGTWYFAVRSVTPTEVSALSPTVTSALVAPACGPAPAADSRSQICTAPTIGNWTQISTPVSAPFPQCWTAGPWVPTEAAAGVCALPSTLTTTSTKAYEQVSPTTPLAMRGLTTIGLPCGPETLTRNSVRYCSVPRSAVDLVVWPADLAITSLWVPAK